MLRFLILLVLGLPWSLSPAAPEVTNVLARQLPGEHRVELTYDLANSGGRVCNVSVQVSNNSGLDYIDIPAEALVGNATSVGENVVPGSKKILIDVSNNVLPPIFSRQIRFKIKATDDVAPQMVAVQGGSLLLSMGQTDVPAFEIGNLEVTWGEWKTVMEQAEARGYDDIKDQGAGCADDHPVYEVNWFDVIKWCNLKSEIEGLTPVYELGDQIYRLGSSTPRVNDFADGFRLPTEAEWEFAARGGGLTHDYTYSGGDNLDGVGWHSGNSRGAVCHWSSTKGTWPVGSKLQNELELYDMSGNVWEWCYDLDDTGNYRRMRGGSFIDSIGQEVSYRARNNSDDRSNNPCGFRIARNLVSDTILLGGYADIPPTSASFVMGSPSNELGTEADEMQHEVNLSAFRMKATEVTKAEWDVVATWASYHGYDISSAGGSGNGADHPVTNVTWYECAKWCNARTEYENATNGTSFDPCYMVSGAIYRAGTETPNCEWTRNGYRLPTEAEWEYACRAGTTRAYNDPTRNNGEGSDCLTTGYGTDSNLEPLAWYNTNSSRTTHPVKGKQPNAWGLYGMHGNVSEWCWDWYGPYDLGLQTNPRGPIKPDPDTPYSPFRIGRGGNWDLNAANCRSATRAVSGGPPNNSYNTLGFRPVRSLIP